tara:strand:+ start:206 stop:352 length:147 start_codon:yes stop_codon:yes gene_type:complete
MGACKAAKRWSFILCDPKGLIRTPEGGVKIHFWKSLGSVVQDEDGTFL